MSGRQDYITKVRYRNDLPPPNCPPRLLKYTSIAANGKSIVSPGILSSVFRKQNFKKHIALNKDSNVNDPLALNLDLIELPGIFDEDDSSALHGLPFAASSGASTAASDQGSAKITLHEKDKALLRNPDFRLGKKEAGHSHPEMRNAASVSFLRKTEYIANKSHFLGSNKSANGPVSALQAKSKNQNLDPESQLANIELSFEQASETLAGPGFQKLRHPTKKNLRAVKTWSLVPNTEMMDQAYFSTKFIGSASLSRTKHKFNGALSLEDTSHNGVNSHNPIFTTSIFKPITLTDDEWMSLFIMNDLAQSRNLKRKIDAAELDEEETFKFKFYKDFDLRYDNYDPVNIKQVAVTLSSSDMDAATAASGTGATTNLEAKYLPIQGKLELKKRRLDPAAAAAEENVHFDEVNLSIRESTGSEEALRDQERSRYDPYNYVAQIEEEDEQAAAEGVEAADAEEENVEDEINEDEINEDVNEST